MSVVVTDPVRFVVGYVGQAAAGDNDAVLGWIKGLFMNGVKTTLGELSSRPYVIVVQRSGTDSTPVSCGAIPQASASP